MLKSIYHCYTKSVFNELSLTFDYYSTLFQAFLKNQFKQENDELIKVSFAKKPRLFSRFFFVDLM